MSKVIEIFGTEELLLPEQDCSKKQSPLGLTAADYRLLLTELKMRPPEHQAFLRQLLKYALAMNAAKEFPVAGPAVTDPVCPT